MLSLLVSLIISLAVLAVVYVILKWLIDVLALPAPLLSILNITVGVVAVILGLRVLFALI